MNDFIHQWYDKSYQAVGILGIQTASGDMTNAVAWRDQSQGFKQLATQPLEFYRERWDTLVGEYWQVPPSYSACKFQGRPLHAWAREGVAILKEPVKRVVQHLTIEQVDFPRIKFSATVSSGTYIRTLFEDMAKKLGTCGALRELTRTSIGPFLSETALVPGQWPDAEKNWHWGKAQQLAHQVALPQALLSPQGSQRYRHGQGVGESMVERITPCNEAPGRGSFLWAISHQAQLLGMAQAKRSSGGIWLIPKLNFLPS